MHSNRLVGARRVMRRSRGPLAAAAIAAALAAGASAGGNLLNNASFEAAGPIGPIVVSTGFSGVGHSAALGWGVLHNTKGTTLTELVPSVVPGGGDFMLHVVTDGHGNGLGQAFGPFNGGWSCVQEQIMIHVVSGTVIIGAGNGGNTGPNAFAVPTGTWQLLSGDNAVCPANNFIIYSWIEGAEFYVDLASVEPFACQGPPGDLNFDGTVDGDDLGTMLGQWGPCRGCSADLDGSGIVDGSDLGSLLGNWGACNPAP